MTTRAGTSYSQTAMVEELQLQVEIPIQDEHVGRQEVLADGRNHGRQEEERRRAGTRAGGEGRLGNDGDGGSGMVELMLRTLMEDRRRQEAEMVEERRRWEEERRRREWEYEEERRRQQAEAAKREEQAMQQMQVLQALVEGVHLQGEAAKKKADNDREVKIPKLTEQDDIVSYLTMFERLMTAFEIKSERWAYKLASSLSGRAQKAYAALPLEEAGDYERLKEAILKRYDITEESYRQRFRSGKRGKEESNRELVARLNDLATKWLKEKQSREEVVDQIVLEQFLKTLPDDIRIYIRERSPKSSEAAAKLADDYLQARKEEVTSKDAGKRDGDRSGGRRCHRCGKQGHLAKDCQVPAVVQSLKQEKGADRTLERRPKKDLKDVECYNCHRKGHYSSNCPQNAMFSSERKVQCEVISEMKRRPATVPTGVTKPGLVEGEAVADILIDSGCTRTMVHQKLVPEGSIKEGEAVAMQCVHGDTVLYPVADIALEVDGRQLRVEAAVSKNLPVSVCLGTDIPGWTGILTGEGVTVKERAFAVTTRAQEKREKKAEKEHLEKQKACGVQPKPMDDEWRHEFEFSDDLFGESQPKPRKTRKQKREERCRREQLQVNIEDMLSSESPGGLGGGGQVMGESSGGLGSDGQELCEDTTLQGGLEGEQEGNGKDGDGGLEGREQEGNGDGGLEGREQEGNGDGGLESREQNLDEEDVGGQGDGEDGSDEGFTHELDIPAQTLRAWQLEDSTLKETWETVKRCEAERGVGFYTRNGLLFRRWIPRGADSEEDDVAVEQLVLPRRCRETVLHLAHSIPLAGHLGRDKTAQRILQRFYWPTLYTDVANFCRTCDACQRVAGKKEKRAPLIPLPVISQPFERIAMDIVGPLPRSVKGNRFVLVVCDYSTRYPEAIPMKHVDAASVAEELMKMFSRVGVPKEILTDQGTNFTSQLLAELYRMLHIHAIKTTPYHPQTDGLVERFNQTLKQMLKKVMVKEGKEWDKLLPYILFAYREVPQASTGFSPFELLYGHHVRGPLDILSETWQADTKSDESVVSHILMVRKKLEKMRSLANVNLEQAQSQQKKWYDKRAREREFQVDDMVMLLLPTSANKLLAQWQGPYRILKKINKVNYLIEMPHRRRKKQVHHVNLLKKWEKPCAVGLMAEEVEEDCELPDWRGEPSTQPVTGNQLTADQRRELSKLLNEFEDVLQGKPGQTHVIEHAINATGKPIRQQAYRIPHAYREGVMKELQEMEESGIIEPSCSEWASPIVVVRKKDGNIRLCVDYRKLNASTPMDAYPMPRVDELLDRLGGARFMTTLDLARGYWQVPVAEKDRPKTAFITPKGLYQFLVMPFGLNGAPATFQRMMDKVLQGLERYTADYIDDIIVFSSSWEEHMRHLRDVLLRLRRSNLIVKLKKCQFGMKECGYLGYVVGNGQVKPDPQKLRAVMEYPVPVTKKEVRGFLGLTGYYRRFIGNYASIAIPLSDLTRKNLPDKVTWTAECEAAFSRLKKTLCQAPVLANPDFRREFVLQTDASDRGVGAVLSQVGEDGKERPISYYSRKLLPREVRYSTIEKECLAIKLGVEAFRVYLLGRKFTIQTDHRSLTWLDKLKENNARLSRWSLILQQYSFVVEHRAGTMNGNADALSRASLPTGSTQEKGEGM